MLLQTIFAVADKKKVVIFLVLGLYKDNGNLKIWFQHPPYLIWLIKDIT